MAKMENTTLQLVPWMDPACNLLHAHEVVMSLWSDPFEVIADLGDLM
jgi:hypothetical protein